MSERPPVFTPASLAERWGCSKATIFRMLRRGDIKRSDFPLIRIHYAEVAKIENNEVGLLPGTVYFLRSGDMVKIGHTADIIYRVRALKASSPVDMDLVFSMQGTRKDEKMLHSRFKDLRSHGEWFHLSGELLDYLKSVGAVQ